MVNFPNAADYAAHGSFVSDLGRPLLSLLDIKPGMRVLDLGCGDGTLALEIKQQGATVVGIDSSPDMVASAVALGIDARLGDGQHLTFTNEFDAVLSNAALHWMAADPQAVVDGVFRALKPGGAFVAELGGHGNVAHIVDAFIHALHHAGLNPDIDQLWYFPSREQYADRLTAAGFTIDAIDLFNRPTPLPTGIEPWLKLFGRSLLMRLPSHDRESAVKRIANTLEPHLRDAEGRWVADYVRLRFVAHKPA
jgi:trans-aconitate methyltransferase